MPSVFLSYARADLEVAHPLTQGLIDHGVSVWRDQDKIYVGQRWPKVLGEAISAQDFLLLLWSKNAAASTYVELEWCTAIALKKTILPCLLDDTPLPSSLKAINAIPAKDPANAIPHILAALSTQVPAVDPTHSAEVIKQLGDITATDSREALEAAKAIFTQHQWTVQGNVYQAARDIHITTVAPTPTRPDKTWLEKWGLVAGLIVSLLTAITLVPQIPKEWAHFPWISDGRKLEQRLAGSIYDQATNTQMPGVRVKLPDFKIETTTDQQGYFSFSVRAPKQAKARLEAEKEGYDPYSKEVFLGDSNIGFKMRRNEE